jgi:hypothetical protein
VSAPDGEKVLKKPVAGKLKLLFQCLLLIERKFFFKSEARKLELLFQCLLLLERKVFKNPKPGSWSCCFGVCS